MSWQTVKVSEADVWADQFAALIQRLDIGPCYVGEYAGCRTTPLLCLKNPELVKGLMLAWPSGGEVAAEGLTRNMYRPCTRAALRHRMEAIVETPMFAASIKRNPSNRDRLLAIEPVRFVRQLAYWEVFFTTSADLPTASCHATDEQWASIEASALVTGGCDPIHPTATGERFHRLLPNSNYHDPVVTAEEWDSVFKVVPYSEVSNLQGERIAPVWREFIARNECRA